jgi:predicted AlkP superfamily pyrophosphatase or phosphodiesterase
MRKKATLFSKASYCLFFSIFSLLQLNAQTDAKAKYVVLISVDGLRPEFYMDASWPMPNLQYMKNNGAYAQGVTGVFPTVTYPSHTTIITGATPANHGVYYNTIFSDTGSTNKWYREEKHIKVATLWDAVKAAGKTSAVVSWPVSVGAPAEYLVPEDWVDDKNGTQSVNPHIRPESLFSEIEREVTGRLVYHKVSLNNLAIDENFSRIAAYLIRTYKPNFTTLHIVSADHAQHGVGREGDAVNKALAAADHALSNVLEAIEMAGIKDSTTIIVTGDHGFVNTNTSFSPNVLLAKKGYIKQNGNQRQWEALFHSGGGSAFLHVKDKKNTKIVDDIRKMFNELPASQKRLFRLVEKDELLKVGADPNAVLAIAAAEGVSISGSMSGDLIRAARGGAHGYFPDFKNIQTGFVAYGAGINKNVVIPEMTLMDIAPLIAHLMGLKMDAPDGILLPGITESQRRR